MLVVDDHPVVREGLRAILSGEPGIQVVGEAASGEEALEKADQLKPDVVLADIRMPGMNGIELTRRIKAAHPGIIVIVLTMYDRQAYVVEAIRAGAAGYLEKDSPAELLCRSIKAAAQGGSLIKSGLLRRAIQGLPRVPGRPSLEGEGQAGPGVRRQLTARELQVLRLVAQGLTNKEIARDLDVAQETVKKHVQNITGKLGASDRTHAAIIAMRLGLVE